MHHTKASVHDWLVSISTTCGTQRIYRYSPDCSRSEATRNALERHLKEHPGETVASCNSCRAMSAGVTDKAEFYANIDLDDLEGMLSRPRP